MEHLIKQTEEETIKRFELNKINIWLIKRGNSYGIGRTKKRAENEVLLNKTYANQGIPNFITEIGSYYKTNNRPEVNSVPGALNFIWSLIPNSWHSTFLFRTIVNQKIQQTFLEIAWVSVPETEPLRYWSDDKAGCAQQITNCIYQFYIDREKNIITKRQNPKLAKWQKTWYSKLQPRKLL